MGLSVSSSTAICVGGTVTINASGASNYTWTNGPQGAFYAVSPTSNTTYTVSAFTPSAGINCPVSNTVLVSVNALPTITATATRTQVCKNETATVTAGGGTSYLWSNFSTSTSFTVKATATAYSYTVTGTDVNGCSNTATVNVKVSNCVGVEELYASGKLALFPNPVSTELSIQFKENVDLQLINTAGQTVRQLSHRAGQTSKLSVLDLPKGVYFLVGETGSEKINEKIIVEK
jgi:uncharacterized membrane protein